MKKLNSKTKKIVILVSAVVLAVAIVTGIVLGVAGSGSKTVDVYDFINIGMTEYWGDTQESYGPVSTDRIQTVYLSDTQTVTEIAVSEGDTVKKGDLLMRFDTSLSDLKLERKQLEVEKAKLDVEDSKTRLQEIKSMKPMSIVTPDTDDSEDENLGVALEGNFQIYARGEHDGSTAERAIICWVGNSCTMGSNFFGTVIDAAEEQQNANAPDPTEPEETEPEETESEESEESDGSDASEAEPEESSAGDTGEDVEPSVPAEKEHITVDGCYIVIKITSGDMSMGSALSWQGVYLSRSSGSYTLRFFSAANVSDYTLANSPSVDVPDVDYGSGYTAAQISQMRQEQEKTVKENEFKLKVAEAEYKIMEREISDGNIYAEIDGTVVSCLTPEDAKEQNQPVLKVSGGGGYTVTGSVSELLKDQLEIGQEITVQDWNTGMSYTGELTSIEDFPSSDSYYSGVGNTNVTYYPFTVFVDESADLREGYYVNISFSTSSTEHGVYLYNPFVRTENGKSYVMAAGEDGRLEKRYVTTGKSLWGSYTEILSGVSENDRLAFPYGKTVKAGAKTVDGNLSDLYS